MELSFHGSEHWFFLQYLVYILYKTNIGCYWNFGKHSLLFAKWYLNLIYRCHNAVRFACNFVSNTQASDDTVNLLSQSLGVYNINEQGLHKRSAGITDDINTDEKTFRCSSHEMHVFGAIGNGASSIVHKAIFIPTHRVLALKKINVFEKVSLPPSLPPLSFTHSLSLSQTHTCSHTHVHTQTCWIMLFTSTQITLTRFKNTTFFSTLILQNSRVYMAAGFSFSLKTFPFLIFLSFMFSSFRSRVLRNEK